MIGDILKRTRTIYGYKASELSELLGISKSYLSEIENNKKQPSLELLKKYSEICGIFLLFINFFRNRVLLFPRCPRNHFMTRVDSHNHTEKRAASEVLVS